MPAPTVSLRPVVEPDLPLLLAWRQNRELIRYMPSAPRSLTWKAHYAWWKDRKARVDYMVMLKERPIGTVHVNYATSPPPEVGIIIGERHAGKGLGSRAMALLLETLTGRFQAVRAVVHPENRASQKLFEGLGFRLTGQIVRGQLEYLKELP